MKYVLLMYANQSKVPRTPEEEQAAAPVWAALAEEVKAAGMWISSSRLGPAADATTLRVRDGKRPITGGPFAETHEQLGSYVLLECQDLDEALRSAKKIPTAEYGSVEVRPLWSQK